MTMQARPWRMITVLAALCSGTLQAAPSASPRYSDFDQDRALRRSQAVTGKPLGDYTLAGTNGKLVRLASLRGKPLLVSFIYTGCFQICPTTTRNLKRAVEAAQRALGASSFNVVSIGFNVPFDTPSAMQAFAHQQGIYLPNWHFLSATQPALEGLSRDLGFTFEGAAAGFEHIMQVSVIDQNGKVYRQVYGASFPLPQLVNPLKELLTGSPPEEESLSQLLDRVRILCTVYDPVTGQYRYKYSILLEIAGGLFALSAVGVFLLRELRKTRLARSRLGS
ncbi:MAG: SCO family protein [Burkholderiales bacterium]